MRAILILITCIAVVGIVVFTVIYSPNSGKTDLAVVRIDMADQPQPVLQSDPAADHVLEFFPKPDEWPSVQPTQQADKKDEKQSDNETTANNPPPTGQLDIESDKGRLMALIEDWAYVDFSEIISKEITRKTGKIQQSRSQTFLDVTEGQTLDNGIKIKQLTNEAAVLNLGQAVFRLRMAKVPAFFAEVRDSMRPLTPDEQEQAYDYYMARFGEKFIELSKDYKPPYGTQMPQKVTSEEHRKGLEQYMNTYGKQFQNEAKMNGAQNPNNFPYSTQQREAYQKYWQRFHPGQPMPDFDTVFNTGNQVGPGARIDSQAGSK